MSRKVTIFDLTVTPTWAVNKAMWAVMHLVLDEIIVFEFLIRSTKTNEF